MCASLDTLSSIVMVSRKYLSKYHMSLAGYHLRIMQELLLSCLLSGAGTARSLSFNSTVTYGNSFLAVIKSI